MGRIRLFGDQIVEVSDVQADAASRAVTSPKAPRFLVIAGQTVRTADVMGVYTDAQWALWKKKPGERRHQREEEAPRRPSYDLPHGHTVVVVDDHGQVVRSYRRTEGFYGSEETATRREENQRRYMPGWKRLMLEEGERRRRKAEERALATVPFAEVEEF